MSTGASSVIGFVEDSPANKLRVDTAVAQLRGGVRGEADTLGKLDALLTVLGDALDTATGDLGGQLAAEAQARANGDTGVISTLRANVRAEADTLFKVDALLSGLAAALSQEATNRAQGDAAVTSALRDGVRNEANTLSKIVFLIDTLTTVVASKATPADITLAVTKIIGGSPEQLDTFGEVFARFQAGDTAFTALANTLSQNVATLTDLIAQANTARASGDTQTLATIRGGVDAAYDTLAEIAAALAQEAGTRAQAVTDLTAAIAAGDTATANALRGGVAPTFDTLNKIATALGQEISTRTQADATLAQAITDGDTASVATVRGSVTDAFNTLAKIAAVLVPKADAVLGNGRVPYDFPTIADAAAATIPAGQRVVRVAGAVVPGTGPSTNVESATQAPGPGRWQSSGPTARYFEPVNAGGLSLEQLGAVSGNPTSFITALQTARLMGLTVVRWDGTVTGVVTPGNYDLFMNVAIIGSGQVEGLDRKAAIPDLFLPAIPQIGGDLVAPIHNPTSCRMPFAIEVTIGDSTGTNQANTNAHSGMISTIIHRTLQEQAFSKGIIDFQFHNRCVGGGTYASQNAIPAITPPRVIDWYTDPTKSILQHVQLLQPTRVNIILGVNDGNGISISSILAVVNVIRSWRFTSSFGDYTTDINFITNLVPKPLAPPAGPADGSWATKATQENADIAAGLIRTIAKYAKVGLIDVHRMCCRGRDGFDPTEGWIKKVRDSVAIPNGAAGTMAVYGGAYHWVFDPTKLPTDGTNPIVIKHGSGDADVVRIAATATPNVYIITNNSGQGGDQLVVSTKQVVIEPPTGQRFELVFEKTGNLGKLYIAGLKFENGYGESVVANWSDLLVSRGGRFVPSVTCAAAGAISTIGFDYGYPTTCRPVVDPTTLEGSNGPDGGSGYNHPSSKAESYVYAPIIRQIAFYGADPFSSPVTRVARFRDATGYDRRFGFETAGFTVYDGYLSAQAGFRLDPANPAVRFYRSGSGNIGAAAGVTTDAAYWEWRASTGIFASLNGGFLAGGSYTFNIDNAFTVGTAAIRASVIYAASGTINTSDAREKLDRDGAGLVDDRVSPLTDAEIAWACALGQEMGVYTWKASYAEKGKDARLHIGMTVQRAIALATECGIANPMRYGFICLDTWEAEEPREAEFAEIEATDKDGAVLTDKDGQPIMQQVMTRPATPGHPAGERYGFRHDELAAFAVAGLFASLDRATKGA